MCDRFRILIYFCKIVADVRHAKDRTKNLVIFSFSINIMQRLISLATLIEKVHIVPFLNHNNLHQCVFFDNILPCDLHNTFHFE